MSQTRRRSKNSSGKATDPNQDDGAPQLKHRKLEKSIELCEDVENSQGPDVMDQPDSVSNDPVVQTSIAKDIPRITVDSTVTTSNSTDCVDKGSDRRSRKKALCEQDSLIALQPSRNPTRSVNVAVASRSLFNLDMIFDARDEQQKIEEYLEKMQENEEKPFPAGAAMPFISALGFVNRCLMQINSEEEEKFNIILMSHNHAHVGVRLIHSINHHNLHIERMCLTGGATPVPHYLEAYNVGLFLTSYAYEVETALEHGFAAAMMSDQMVKNCSTHQLKIAFDLDAVLFSAESEIHYKSGGLTAFFQHEKEHSDELLEEGPLKKFATALGRMQTKLKQNASKYSNLIKECPIKIYVVTARSAASAGERAIKTLRAWGLYIDEIHFLAGAPKGPILNAIKPHIFFDDQCTNIQSAQEYGVSAAQVRSGIANKKSTTETRPKYRRNLSIIQDLTPQSPLTINECADENGEEDNSQSSSGDNQ